MKRLVDGYLRMSMGLKLLLLAVLAGLVGYMSWEENVTPAQESLEAAIAEEEQLTQELENLSKSGQSLTAIEATKRKTEEEIHALFELLPKDVDIDRLLAGFADAARESGVSLKKFTPAKTEGASIAPPPTNGAGGAPAPSFGPDSLQRFPVAVILEGTYMQLTTFFDKVLSLPRIVRLDTFKFEPASTSASSATNLARPGGTYYPAPVPTPTDNSGGSKLSLRTTPDGSTILKCDAMFTAYVQKGDFSALFALSTPSQAKSSAPGAGNASSDDDTQNASDESAAKSSGEEKGMSAKPLNSSTGGGE